MKKVFYSAVLLSFLACNNANQEAPSNSAEANQTTEIKKEVVKEKAEVLSSELKPYEIDDNKFVNSIEAEIYNGAQSASYQYCVTVYQEENTYNDTITFYIANGDTARHQLVFNESPSLTTKPASFSAKLIMINKD